MASKKELNQDNKVAIQSLLDSTLLHNDIVINAHEIVLVNAEDAECLVYKGFCKKITVSTK